MNYIQLHTYFSSNHYHTPDAICNCSASLPQTEQQSHPAQTTVPKRTKPHIGHISIRPATDFVRRGAGL